MRMALLLVIFGGISWNELWFTADQQGQRRMDSGQFRAAAESFRDPIRQGVAWFHGGEFEKAEQAFARSGSPEAEFNRGNCLVMLGKYDEAVRRYDRALELRPDWDDAKINREVAIARAKLTEQTGGDMGDQKIGADEIVFDKQKEAVGQETKTTEGQPLTDEAMQALWLRRVQTSPAEFLRAKFAYQLSTSEEQGVEP